jgi:hypothetical protein
MISAYASAMNSGYNRVGIGSRPPHAGRIKQHLAEIQFLSFVHSLYKFGVSCRFIRLP